jgi:hypothetical protein
VEVDLWSVVNHFNRPKSGQWQQSMFPRGCIGWRMATTAVASEAAVVTSAMETIAMVAAMMRRRVRAGVVIVIVKDSSLVGGEAVTMTCDRYPSVTQRAVSVRSTATRWTHQPEVTVAEPTTTTPNAERRRCPADPYREREG